ncbi:MAG: pyrroline-5-carboxylate reductase [Gammaproteobacteria bacterium]|nr:pyrroline-5-carboxylate reductase [Gammaproteobacteria bacterium]
MSDKTIAFIGGGNMAASLIGGLIAGSWPVRQIRVAEPVGPRRQKLASRFGVTVTGSNSEAVAAADVVVLAVKPQTLRAVARELGPGLTDRSPLIVSIAAGVREPDIRRWLGFPAAVVRAMPNTPALVGSGATGLFANTRVSQEQRDLAESVLRAVGMVLWIDDEAQMDAVTALSGSGPAYFFLVMELMEEAGGRLGLPAETSRLLTLETAFGAAKMALESAEDPAGLRRRVTSPGGTTARAVQHLEDNGLRSIFQGAMEAARDRAAEIGQELGTK